MHTGAELVPAPAARLRVALANLLENVAKFAALTTPWAKVEVRRLDSSVRIAVEDHGPGIPADQRIPDYQNVIAGSFVAENNS